MCSKEKSWLCLQAHCWLPLKGDGHLLLYIQNLDMQPIHSAAPVIFNLFVEQSQTYSKFDKHPTDNCFVLIALRVSCSYDTSLLLVLLKNIYFLHIQTSGHLSTTRPSKSESYCVCVTYHLVLRLHSGFLNHPNNVSYSKKICSGSRVAFCHPVFQCLFP